MKELNMKYNKIKKGMVIRTKSEPQSSLPNVECSVEDNHITRHTRLVKSPCINGGYEFGEIYTTDMEYVKVDNDWELIEHSLKADELIAMRKSIGF
tara:strand:- start:390 stop:677 length:288 start_codon:yes stop_codon:yes gene_type:complete